MTYQFRRWFVAISLIAMLVIGIVAALGR